MSTKAKLLVRMKAHPGEWVSGEWLSHEFGVSRSALWKHVGSLKRKGYEIESSPKKGYRLHWAPDLLLPHEIQERLNTEALGPIRAVVVEETDSTNRQAKDLAIHGAPEGTVVIAERQTQGRGRRGRDWFSPEGEGIYCSLLLRPKISPAEISGITLMTGVAVAELLQREAQIPARIKWPNDILVGGRKIAGILTEVTTEMDRVEFAIVGLGLNVNTPRPGFPPSLRQKATSLLIETGKSFSRTDLLRAYLQGFDHYYAIFRKQGLAPILERWKMLTEMMGKQVQVDLLGNRIAGEALDIDRNGALILRDSEGEIHRILSGDVILPKAGRPKLT